MTTEKVDVLVIGAGPSGTIAASIIKQAGFTVKIGLRRCGRMWPGF